VFASLHTQPLESEPIRALIRGRLALPGYPQMLLQLGRAHTTRTTARRPPADLTDPETAHRARRQLPLMPHTARGPEWPSQAATPALSR